MITRTSVRKTRFQEIRTTLISLGWLIALAGRLPLPSGIAG
jgi:hypothetical protein